MEGRRPGVHRRRWRLDLVEARSQAAQTLVNVLRRDGAVAKPQARALLFPNGEAGELLNRKRPRCLTGDGEKPPLAGDALQLRRAPVLEFEP